jgi:hypothetical protein
MHYQETLLTSMSDCGQVFAGEEEESRTAAGQLSFPVLGSQFSGAVLSSGWGLEDGNR